MKPLPTRIEQLEDRIAPAAVSSLALQIAADTGTEAHQDAVHLSPDGMAPIPSTLINAKTATYTDVDGDKVTVSFSKPILTAANLATILVTASSGIGDQLLEIDLTSVAAGAKGTTITVSAAPTATVGDGQVNVGEIVATGIDLGQVTVHGDLGLILAGADSGAKDVALKGLTVNSLGVFGSSTGAAATVTPDGDYDATTLAGSAGPVLIHGDATDFTFSLASSLATIPAYSFSTITVGGEASSDNSIGSEISTQTGSFGAIKIGGSIIDLGIQTGGAGKIASITVGGDVIGVYSVFQTATGKIGAVKVGGSAEMEVEGGGIAGVTVGGDVSGLHLNAGATGKIGAVKIDGSLDTATIGDGPVASVSVGGTVQNLTIDNTSGKIGSLTIGGSFYGGTIESDAGTIGSISVKGVLTATIQSELGIGSIKVGGTVSETQILVGYGAAEALYTKSVKLGSLTVGGDWVASDVAVGVINFGSDDAPGGTGSAADNVNFGNSDDSLFTAVGSTAKINAISIAGEVLGTPGTTGDSFAFVAGQIVSFKSGGVTIPLKAGPGNDDRPLGLSGDVVLKEMPLHTVM